MIEYNFARAREWVPPTSTQAYRGGGLVGPKLMSIEHAYSNGK